MKRDRITTDRPRNKGGIHPYPLPQPGDRVTVLGVRATVRAVTPEHDWSWRIELTSVNGLGAAEVWSVHIPTDYRTSDGAFVRES